MKYLLLLLSLTTLAISAAEKPNIVFFLVDDQRNDFLGCTGHPIIQTPNIDKLADQGTLFKNAFVTTATCWVSRASILTGMYMRKHRFQGGLINPKYIATSYPMGLKKAGYQTAYFGKTHFRLDKKQQAKMFDEFKQVGRNPFHKKMPDGSLKHETDIIADLAIDFIKRQSEEKPFFVNMNFNATHAEDSDKKDHFPYPESAAHLYTDMTMPLPKLHDRKIFESQPKFMQNSMHNDRYKWRWDTPEKYQHNMRNYLRMASGIDFALGRVVDALKEKNLNDNTVIIYTADNGYYAGDRGFAGKWTHYEQSLRVPLIIFDGRNQKGQKLSQIALNIDLGATMLDYAGMPTPKQYNGSSLKPLIEGEKVEWRKEFMGEFYSKHKTIPNWEGIRAERYVYASYPEEGFEFLHDLQKDPDQLQNFAKNPEYKEILKKMRKRLRETADPQGKPFVTRK
ncbi:sulfatase [Lentisphaera araneosa]|nr:sulfatase [Lentisphaera araneosa]